MNDADKKDFMSFNFLSSHSVVPKSINSGSLLAGKKIGDALTTILYLLCENE